MGLRRVLGLVAITLASSACNGTDQHAAAATSPPASAEGEADPDVRALFEAYLKTLNDHTLPTSQQFFTPRFVYADPNGHQVVENDAARRGAIEAEDEYYKNNLGMTSARLVSIKQISM